jgi:hypothetical protein
VSVIETVRILHHHSPGYGWSYDSPDIPGLTGGTETYDPAQAEQAAAFALTCAAEEEGRPALGDVSFEHYVPAGSVVAA